MGVSEGVGCRGRQYLNVCAYVCKYNYECACVYIYINVCVTEYVCVCVSVGMWVGVIRPLVLASVIFVQ